METTNLELRPLRIEDEDSFKKAVKEFENERPTFEFAFQFDPSTDFSEYVKKLAGWTLGIGLSDNFVPNTYYVGVVNGVIVGRLSLRHKLNDFLARLGGHIGYGVIPTQRNRGYATEMLKQGLSRCKELQIERTLLTCDINNVGSRKVIETCGGQFEGVTDDPTLKVQRYRYWISTGQ